MDNLTNKLTRILANRIQHALPEIQKEVKKKLSEVMNELEELGDAPPSGVAEMRQVYINKVLVSPKSFQVTIKLHGRKHFIHDRFGGMTSTPKAAFITDDDYGSGIEGLGLLILDQVPPNRSKCSDASISIDTFYSSILSHHCQLTTTFSCIFATSLF